MRYYDVEYRKEATLWSGKIRDASKKKDKKDNLWQNIKEKAGGVAKTVQDFWNRLTGRAPKNDHKWYHDLNPANWSEDTKKGVAIGAGIVLGATGTYMGARWLYRKMRGRKKNQRQRKK